MLADYPLVSAIMPTRARPQFARQAIECFLSQTWTSKELVIVDDFMAPSFDVPPPVEGIRYVVERRQLTIGAKRNRACAEATGDIICHWDDDDYSAPGRIEDQVCRLIESGADMTGYSEMEFRDGARRWLYRGTDGYMLGTSLMYQREYWLKKPFEDLRVGEDLIFQAGARSVAVPAGGCMWARTHPGNTSSREVSDVRFVELACA